MKKTKLPQPIRVHSDVKKEIAKELNVTTQTVRMASGYERHSKLSKRIRSLCKEKLIKEAKIIVILFLSISYSLQSFSQIDGSSLVRLINVASENDLSTIINPLMGCIAYAEGENKVFHYDGSNWMSIEDSDDQNLILLGTTLYIQDGNNVDLSNFNDQNLSLQANDNNNSRASINIEGGNGLVFKANGNLQLTENTSVTPHELTFTTTADGDGDAWNVSGEDLTSSISREGSVAIGLMAPAGKFDVNSSQMEEHSAYSVGTNVIAASSSYFGTNYAGKVLVHDGKYWQPSSSSQEWFTIDLGVGNAVKPSKYKITAISAGSVIQGPASWTFQGSNDNNQWTVLHSSNNSLSSTSEYFQLNTQDEFRYFKLHINYSFAPLIQINNFQIFHMVQKRFIVDDNYNVGINKANPNASLEIDGSVYVSGGGNLCTGPDSRIGIGVNSPAAALHVNGNGLFSGLAMFSNFLATENCGIGTSFPTQKLHVVGNILASGTITPDYVFKEYYDKNDANKEYDFKNLKEIEQFVKKHKHLPGVPSEKDIEEQGGIIVNRATEINLEKIEELYIHLIEMEKRLSLLENKK